MYRTIRVSSCVLVQGEFVEVLADGQVVIRDGNTEYRGSPIPKRSPLGLPAAIVRALDQSARPT